MPHDRVRGNHDELKQIATLFGQEADATQRTLASLRQRKDVLQGGDWIGQSARAFYGEMDSALLPAMSRLQRALTQAQNVTHKIAAALRQCEADAARQLRDREGFDGQAGASGPGSPGTAGSDGTAGGNGSTIWSGSFQSGPFSGSGSVSGPSGDVRDSGPFGQVAQGSVYSAQGSATFSPLGGGSTDVKVTGEGRVLGGEAGYGFNQDVQGAYAEGYALSGKGGVQLGEGEGWYRQSVQVDVLGGSAWVGHRGSNYGIGAEANTIKVTGSTVLGTQNAALTSGGELAGPAANAYAGIKDGSIGAEAGASYAGVKAEGGFNVFGWNVGLVGEADLGVGIGVSVGKKTSVKLGPFAVGITFGRAK